ncbi:MAG: hypothetical protein GY866_02910 [Proteobacteria bacterium]|nr:hypothetical protein [Pseudomonadota bacterium]
MSTIDDVFAALTVYIDPTNITKTVPGFACRSLRSLTVFVPIFAGYWYAVPLRGDIYIFSSLPAVGEGNEEKIY